MSFDLSILADKLNKYREQFQLSLQELSEATGIDQESLSAFELGNKMPTGDQILILADIYKCDYKFFISDEKLAPFEQTEILFRSFGSEFSRNDRWAVQEVLYLSECEHFLINSLGLHKRQPFKFVKYGPYFKGHAENAASELRMHLGYQDNAIPMDIYEDFRSIGIHVFRRKLENSNISGLFIKHPIAGKCILINYSEDVYRQRFTASHEAGHSILDDEKDFIISFNKWDKNDLVEVRANTFASRYLMPPTFLQKLQSSWDDEEAVNWANRLKVSTEALANALSGLTLIDEKTARRIKRLRVPKGMKADPELPDTLSLHQRMRKQTLLEKGLSTNYINRCFESYHRGIISTGRMAEMLLITEPELYEIACLFGEVFNHAS